MPCVRDVLGEVVEQGDIILSCAATSRGLVKLGKVYGFNKNGCPMVQYVGKKYDLKQGKYVEGWQKGEAGSHVLVISKHNSPFARPERLLDRVHMDYDAERPAIP